MLSRRSVLYLVCGGLLLVGGALAYSAVPGEDYRVTVTPTDADSAENVTGRQADVYAYDDLSPTAQSVFRDGRAAGGESILVGSGRWPDEFEYGTDTEGHTVVSDGGTYYLVVAWQPQCLGALCDPLRALCGATALVGLAVASRGVQRAVG